MIGFIREFFEDMPVMASISTLIMLILLLATVDFASSFGNEEIYNGVIVDKQYSARRTSTGTGTAIGTNGRVGVVTTTDTSPEKFLLMVRDKDGKIHTVTCEPELYYVKENEDSLRYFIRKGRVLGGVWSIKGIE